MKTTAKLLTPAMALVVFCGFASAAPGVVGSVKTVQGHAVILREGQNLPAQAGQKLLEMDTLQTGADGSIGVVFRDDTRLSLGNNSSVRIDQFVFAPAKGKLAIVLNMARGVAAYVSGKIAALSPNASRLITPVATVGIRGTRFVARVVPE
jgi:hypothetical protein